MNDPEALLDQASRVLADATAYSNRAACWIARAALESTMDALLDNRHRSAPEATMRSKLAVLQVAYANDPEVAARAEYAWNGLSRACHQHAYELSPTNGEATHLLDLVRSISRPDNSDQVSPDGTLDIH